MSFIGAACKLVQDAGMKVVWSTVYKENSIQKRLQGIACSRTYLLTDNAFVTKQSTKTKSFNTNNQKCKKRNG